MKEIIQTIGAPEAIGTYSQAVKAGDTLYISGQIPLNPTNMELISQDISEQINQVFKNLYGVLEAAGADFTHLVKLNVYLTDLSNFSLINEIMAEHMAEPYPARAAVQVSALPKEVQVEIDAVAVISA